MRQGSSVSREGILLPDSWQKDMVGLEALRQCVFSAQRAFLEGIEVLCI